jgi:hypothetical protein
MISQLADQYGVPMLITAASILLILHYLFTGLFDPLRDVKGPTLARYTRLWEMYKNWQGQLEHVTVSLHKQYGNLIYLILTRFRLTFNRFHCPASSEPL